MGHRITYIHNRTNAVRQVGKDHLELDPDIEYVQEHRVSGTSGSEYSHIKDLRIQISTNHRPSFPFSHDFTSGLHVYAVPQGLSGSDGKENFYEQLERLLYDLLGLEIRSDAFILAYNSFYYHSAITDFPGAFSGFETAAKWSKLDYYRSNGEFTLKSLSHDPDTTVSSPDHRVEVGVFSIMDQSENDDVIVSGGRVVMGDASEKPDKLTKTLFHIKPRHRTLHAKASSKITDNGLHPVLAVDAHVQAPADPDISNCQLYMHMTLEKSIFVDPYQIPSQLSLIANYGSQNLELPEYLVPQWGNELLFGPSAGVSDLNFSMALHSRYQLPSKSSPTHVIIDKPTVFYACEVSDDAMILKQSPFDNFHYLGGTFEKFFTENSVFYHVPDAGQLGVTVPNATRTALWTNGMTFGALFLGCLLVARGLFNRLRAVKTDGTKKSQ